jgi:hypothetical protein
MQYLPFDQQTEVPGILGAPHRLGGKQYTGKKSSPARRLDLGAQARSLQL